MGLFDFFTGGDNSQDTVIEITKNRGTLKNNIRVSLMRCGFTEMEVNEVINVIELAEADIRIAEDSIKHCNINNPDPTRSMHAAIEDIRRYQKELAYDVRKKIMEIMQRKRAMRR